MRNLIKSMKRILILLFLVIYPLIGFSKTLITSASQVGNTSSITVNWGETDVTINPPSVSLNRYQIKYKPLGGSEISIDNISNSLRTFTLTGLDLGSTYEIELIEVIRVNLPYSPYNLLPYFDIAIGSGLSIVPTNAAPIAVCNALTVSVGDNCTVTIAAEQIGAGSSDPNGDAITYAINSSGVFGVGIYPVSLTVTDIHNVSNTCLTTLTVVDSQAPKVLLKDAIVILNAAGVGSLSLSEINAGISDNCEVSKIQVSKTQFGCEDIGDQRVSVMVTDVAGNNTTAMCTVKVMDVTKPNVKAKNVVMNLNFDGFAVLDPKIMDDGTWDLCGSHTLKLSKSVFSCEDVGNNMVTLIATDASGNESRTTANVEIIDAIAPYSTNKNIELSLNANGEAILNINNPALNIYDVCGIKYIVFSKEKLTCEIKTNVVGITATDKNNNIGKFDVTVTLKDLIFPEIKTKPINIYLDKDGKASLTPNMINDGSSDNCKIDTMYLSKNSFNCENIGKDTVIFYAKDSYGNISMKKESITVIDSISPIIKTKEIALTLNDFGKAQIKVEDIENGSTDNCGIKTKTLSKTEFDCSNIGNVELLYTVEDKNGNISKKILIINITETIKPSLKLKENITLNLDKDGFLKLTEGQIIAVATDNCGIKQISFSIDNFSCSNLGKNQIVVSLTDNSGNISTATTDINVIDSQGVCLCSYAMLASESIEIDGSNLEYGGLGTYQAGKKIILKNTTYGLSNVFAKSDILQADNQPSMVIKGIAPSPLPYEPNEEWDNKNLKVKNGKQLDFGSKFFGKVKIGKNATLTFTGTGDLYFKTLKIKKGGKLNFEQTAKVHIKSYIRLAEEITINESQENVKVFVSKNVGIDKGSQINAYLHSQEGIDIKAADEDKKTKINGLLIANKIKSGANVILLGQPTDCSNILVTSNLSDSLIAENGESSETLKEEALIIEPSNARVIFGPNPATEYVNITLPYTIAEEKVKIIVRDSQGRQVRTQESMIDNIKNLLQIDLRKLQTGLYFIELETKIDRQMIKLQVLK